MTNKNKEKNEEYENENDRRNIVSILERSLCSHYNFLIY